MPSVATPSVIAGHYRLTKKLGEGSFGQVWEGVGMMDDKAVAVKLERYDCDPPMLRDEYKTYKQLKGVPGVPDVHFYGVEGDWNVLVMDLLGSSIEDMFDKCGRKLCAKTVAMLAKQMIRRVQAVHENHLVYRDIKPDNFMLGLPRSLDANNVFIIDFGMAKLFRDPRTRQHAVYKERRSLTGTARYMSINTHLGREQSRRDDLEALGHVFIYLLKGKLPWQGLKAPTSKDKYKAIGETKQSTTIRQLCRGLPDQVARYLSYACKLKYEETPDYDYCRGLFTEMLKEAGGDDSVYEWTCMSKGFRLTKKLGEGSFGAVYKGVRASDRFEVAIKLEKRKTDVPQLADEYKVYKSLEGSSGIPECYYFGQEGPWNCLVMDLLGKSLEDTLELCGRHFSLKTVAMCAKQMIARVQAVHSKHMIYRDIKPDNFMFGPANGRRASTIYLIDFGLASLYRDPQTRQHVRYKENQPLEGTARYLSVNAHLGVRTSRRDDLESLGYVLIYLSKGILPWQGIKGANDEDKYRRIGKLKADIPMRELCRGLPVQFGQYIQYTRKLRFDETPDYTFLRSLFSRVLRDIGQDDDGEFDHLMR